MSGFPTKTLLLLALLQTNLSLAAIPTTNSTWTYDSLYNKQGTKTGLTPGLFANNISNYNSAAEAAHKFTQVFIYGGDLEMYCKGSGGSSASTACNKNNMNVYYGGQTSTAAYYNALSSSGMKFIAIVDGVVNLKGADDYLSAFNTLNQASAAIYADKVAALYCADSRIDGVQFDIEPFDLTQPGQLYFFQEIAKDFAGKNKPTASGADPLQCLDATHPQGRVFSVFTAASKVTATVAQVLNQYQNGYVIDSLYDLGANPAGVVNSPATYGTLVNKEVIAMMNVANKLQVNFQFGIPGAASVHEFETKAGVKTGYTQLQYVKAAINAINTNKARNSSYFRGINIWSWNSAFYYGGVQYAPSTPPANVLKYLNSNY